jgi:membrane protein YqaA with SNARE-associated domain
MWAYLTLFGWSFAAATILPLGSEPAVVYLVGQGLPLLAIVAVATLGNYLGACTTYVVGRVVGFRLDARQHRRGRRATEMMSQYGAPALLLSWVPLLGDAIVAAAGVAGTPFGAFSLWTVTGKLARYLAVAYGARALTVG